MSSDIRERLPPNFICHLENLCRAILLSRPVNFYGFAADFYESELTERTLNELAVPGNIIKSGSTSRRAETVDEDKKSSSDVIEQKTAEAAIILSKEAVAVAIKDEVKNTPNKAQSEDKKCEISNKPAKATRSEDVSTNDAEVQKVEKDGRSQKKPSKTKSKPSKDKGISRSSEPVLKKHGKKSSEKVQKDVETKTSKDKKGSQVETKVSAEKRDKSPNELEKVKSSKTQQIGIEVPDLVISETQSFSDAGLQCIPFGVKPGEVVTGYSTEEESPTETKVLGNKIIEASSISATIFTSVLIEDFIDSGNEVPKNETKISYGEINAERSISASGFGVQSTEAVEKNDKSAVVNAPGKITETKSFSAPGSEGLSSERRSFSTSGVTTSSGKRGNSTETKTETMSDQKETPVESNDIDDSIDKTRSPCAVANDSQKINTLNKVAISDAEIIETTLSKAGIIIVNAEVIKHEGPSETKDFDTTINESRSFGTSDFGYAPTGLATTEQTNVLTEVSDVKIPETKRLNASDYGLVYIELPKESEQKQASTDIDANLKVVPIALTPSFEQKIGSKEPSQVSDYGLVYIELPPQPEQKAMPVEPPSDVYICVVPITMISPEQKVRSENPVEADDYGLVCLELPSLQNDHNVLVEPPFDLSVVPIEKTPSFEQNLQSKKPFPAADYGLVYIELPAEEEQKETSMEIASGLEVVPIKLTPSFQQTVQTTNQSDASNNELVCIEFPKETDQKDTPIAPASDLTVAPIELTPSLEQRIGPEKAIRVSDYGLVYLEIPKGGEQTETPAENASGLEVPLEITQSYEQKNQSTVNKQLSASDYGLAYIELPDSPEKKETIEKSSNLNVVPIKLTPSFEHKLKPTNPFDLSDYGLVYIELPTGSDKMESSDKTSSGLQVVPIELTSSFEQKIKPTSETCDASSLSASDLGTALDVTVKSTHKPIPDETFVTETRSLSATDVGFVQTEIKASSQNQEDVPIATEVSNAITDTRSFSASGFESGLAAMPDAPTQAEVSSGKIAETRSFSDSGFETTAAEVTVYSPQKAASTETKSYDEWISLTKSFSGTGFESVPADVKAYEVKSLERKQYETEERNTQTDAKSDTFLVVEVQLSDAKNGGQIGGVKSIEAQASEVADKNQDTARPNDVKATEENETNESENNASYTDMACVEPSCDLCKMAPAELVEVWDAEPSFLRFS